MASSVEDTSEFRLEWSKLAAVGVSPTPVLPVVLQDATSGDVLFVGYTDRACMVETLESGEVVLFSTSRQERWHKGATSGDTLELVEARVNCEQNSLLYRVVRTTGRACHSRDDNGVHRADCYYRRLGDGVLEFVEPS